MAADGIFAIIILLGIILLFITIILFIVGGIKNSKKKSEEPTPKELTAAYTLLVISLAMIGAPIYRS